MACRDSPENHRQGYWFLVEQAFLPATWAFRADVFHPPLRGAAHVHSSRHLSRVPTPPRLQIVDIGYFLPNSQRNLQCEQHEELVPSLTARSEVPGHSRWIPVHPGGDADWRGCGCIGDVTKADAQVTRAILDKYENSVKRDLDDLDSTLRRLAELPYLKIFGLDDEMLGLATKLALDGVAAKPFDHAILASILVRSSNLWDAGEREISFCEAGTDTGTPSRLSRLFTRRRTFGCTETTH
jgi:hypothetical protein